MANISRMVHLRLNRNEISLYRVIMIYIYICNLIGFHRPNCQSLKWLTKFKMADSSRMIYIQHHLKRQIYLQVRRLISRFCILSPGHWTYSSVCQFKSTESIPSCSHVGALNLSYTLPSLSYQVLIYT